MTTALKERQLTKAVIKTETLRHALQQVNLIPYPSNGTLPILADVHISFADGKATLSRTDLERSVQVVIDAETTEPFTTVLPRQTVGRFLYGGNGTVTIAPGDRQSIVNLEREGLGKIAVWTKEPKDFPPLPQAGEVDWHMLDAKWFCRMLSYLIPACATEDSKPILTGIVCRDGDMASADGFRLAVVKSDKLSFGLGTRQAIIPVQTAIIAQKLFAREDAVEMAFELEPKFLVHFRAGNVSLVSQLIQGNFPRYEQLIPASYRCKATFSVPLMVQRLQMINEAELYGRIVRLDFHSTELGESQCALSARVEDSVEYALTLPVAIDGDGSRIALNHKYVMDAIKPFSVCVLEITSPESSGKFTGDIEELTIVVMPMFVIWGEK